MTQLLLACIWALVTVFVLLGLLAIAMRALIAVFPERTPGADPALVAAVTTAASATYPGMRVTKVEEEQ